MYRVEALKDRFYLFKVAEIEHNVPPPSSFLADWGQAVRLVNATVETEASMPVLNLDWWIGGPIDPDQTVFVHVRNAAGEVVAQFDGNPISNLGPLGTWAPGDLVRERRPLLLPASLAPGHYTLAVGLYNWQSTERLHSDQTHTTTADDALVVGEFDYPLATGQTP